MKKKDLCKTCGLAILWRLNIGNVPLAFDPVPTEEGAFFPVNGHMFRFWDYGVPHYDGPRYQLHSLSCPPKPKEAK